MGLLLFTAEDAFQKAFNQLREASPPKKRIFQHAALVEAAALLKEPKGITKLFVYAHLFDEAGIFAGKPWENVRKLNPALVRGTLQTGGITEAAEALSELRILAIARGVYMHPEMSAYEATEFLTKVLALNLDLLLMKETEENRVKQLFKDKHASEILTFISDHCFSPLVFQSLYEEIDNLAVQRPIVTDKILKLIANAKKLAGGLEELDSSLMHYEAAVYTPSNLACGSEKNYENKLKTSQDMFLIREARQLSASMNQSGLVSPYQALFLKHINQDKNDLLEDLLAVDETSRKNVRSNRKFVSSIITNAVRMNTRRSIYGLMRLLQRDIFTAEFTREIEKLYKVPIHEHIEKRILAVHQISEMSELRSLVVSGMISVLGQPLGIGQGFNPTCQSTRALSYWSQKEPLMLVNMYHQLLEQGCIAINFEGESISSDSLSHVPLDDVINIDIVSQLLIPHLDSIYLEMLKYTSARGEDPHKWINPAFHIQGIWDGFSDVYNDTDFAARFFRHYHPSHNPCVNEGLPQPAGITIYNHAGQVLGAHAVLIQRVFKDPEGCTRVYFYNPNNDSLQLWGSSIKTSVSGKGELEGESSLPFEEFLSFLYAFHFPKQDG